MNAFTFFTTLALVVLAVDLSCGRSQSKENPAKVPRKWQEAREQNAHATRKKEDSSAEPVLDDAPVNDASRSTPEDKDTADNSAQREEEPVEPVEPVEPPKTDSSNESTDDGYGAGSLCGYCRYCKFCKLCDKDCPCETSKEKPNCHLCKYCKYCSVCSVCNTVCTPGGFIDMFTSSIYSSLPSLDKGTKEKVDQDIENARDFIKEYL